MTDRRDSGRRARVERSLAWLDRYRDLLDDPVAFRRALDEPVPADLLVPAGRERRDTVLRRLRRRGIEAVAPGPWAADHVRLRSVDRPGRLPEVVFGLAFPQGAVSGVPARALGVQGADRVLDLCAAPGGKTVHLAALAGPGARVLANEPGQARSGLLVQAVARHGASSVVSVRHDGASFPLAGTFDRILVDAPCTGEGTFRVDSPRYEPRGETGLGRAAAVQRRLLERAVGLLEPGGRLVYSTCSYAPEENESVVHEILRRHEELDVLELPGDVPGLPGVVRWRRERYDRRLTRARRILPHHTGSWGFFVAAMERPRGSGPATVGRAAPGPAEDLEARGIFAKYMRERFGLEEHDLADHDVVLRGRDLWLRARVRREADATGLRVTAPGIRALRARGSGGRATNAALRLLGPRLVRRVLEVEWETAVGLLESGSLPAPSSAPRGHVALRVDGTVVGSATVEAGRVRLQIPRAWHGQ